MYNQVLHSIWLQSLGNAIIHSLWQGLILLLFYKLCLLTFKKIKPSGKHNLSVLLVIISFIWFVITFLHLLIQTDVPALPVNKDLTFESVRTLFPKLTAYTSSILSLAYLSMLGFMLTRLAISIKQAGNWKQASLINPGQLWIDFTNRSALLLRINRKVTIWFSESIQTPFTIGFLKPVILLPVACLTHLSPDQIEAIILHELSHIRRNDYLTNLLLSVVETLLFFNPAVFVFMQTIRNERENCCDDMVLAYQYEPEKYARALLQLSKNHLNHQTMAMPAVSRRNVLLHRIKRITGNEAPTTNYYFRRVTVYFITIGLLFGVSPFLPGLEKKLFAKKELLSAAETIKVERVEKSLIKPLPAENTNITPPTQPSEPIAKKKKTVYKEKAVALKIIPAKKHPEPNRRSRHRNEYDDYNPYMVTGMRIEPTSDERTERNREFYSRDYNDSEPSTERWASGNYYKAPHAEDERAYTPRSRQENERTDSIRIRIKNFISGDSIRIVKGQNIRYFSMEGFPERVDRSTRQHFEEFEKYFKNSFPHAGRSQYKRPLRKADI